jgi:hypothetical protein
MRSTGYRVMTLDEKIEFDSEVSGMKARAYLDATEAMMKSSGVPAGCVEGISELRESFEARIAPGGESSDAIGTIYAARECENHLLDEIRVYGLDPDRPVAAVDDPFDMPRRHRSIDEATLDFA